ncbi:hypothetical protein B0H14DRAFT_2597952 [Mycena olivaceomarginata]|nr:hypothetical protein B0H14DRAFT_2597952 [Mycena olivaceomarginata]
MTQAQYYMPHPTAAHIAPTQPSNPPILTPNLAPANPVLMFSPANTLPTALTTHCAPGACEICDAPHLCIINQAPHPLNSVQTAPLHRSTCCPIFYPENPGINIEMHYLEVGKYFYVANLAREEGIYTSRRSFVFPFIKPFLSLTEESRSINAHRTSEGVINGLHMAATTFAEAQGLWALSCLRWHGHECKHECLERIDAQGKHWALKGSEVICGSRATVFQLAKDTYLNNIHICGHHNVSVLIQ